MIITIKGSAPDIFKDSNIGTLSTWSVSRVLGDGATYSGDTFVDKNAALNATVTITEGYELGSAGVTVTMNGVPVTSGVTTNGNIVTIAIASVTGNVVIKVPTKKIGGSEPETPATYTVTYVYVDSNGATVKTSTTETVTAGTSMTFNTSNAPAVSGYAVSSVSPTSATINSNTTVTYYYTAAVAGNTVLFDFDFVNNTLDNYVSSGVISIPSTSKTDTLTYDSRGLTTTGTSTPACLGNGVKLANPFDVASQSWTFEVTMTIDPWEESTGVTEALYPNMMFFSAAEHDTLPDGKAHGSNCLAPAIYINGGKFSGRFPDNGNVTIGSAAAVFDDDGVEHTYKWVYDKTNNKNIVYKDGTSVYNAAWTNTTADFGGTMQYVLGVHNGYSSAKNFAIKMGYHIKSMKMYTN